MKAVWSGALALMLATGVAAQEPAEDEPRQRPERWGFELNVALTSTSGNEQISVLVTDIKVSHLQTQAFKLDWSARVRYGRSQGEDVAQNMQSALTLELYPRARWSPFVTGQAEKDPFKRLDLRTSSGAGVRYRLLQADRGELTLSGAALHSYENLQVPSTDLETTELTHNARWRWIGKGRYALAESVEAEHRTFYEPVWDRAGDYLMEVENTVLFRLNSSLSFRVAHVFQRDSSPPPDVAKNDYVLTLGVGYKTRF